MKNLILSLVTVASFSVSAHTIVGNPPLKGSLKTKIEVNGLKTTCTVKIEKVKNLMLEDSYGNPAYNVRTNISLTGNSKIKFAKDFQFKNLFVNGARSEVRDLEFFAEGNAKLLINGDGRIRSVSFPFNNNQNITCSF